MTSISRLSTLVAIGALLGAPLAMAQQQSWDAGTSHGMSGQTSHGMSATDQAPHRGVGTALSQNTNSSSGKTNLNPGGTDHDVGMANANGSSYHFSGQKNFNGNANNGWNAQNTGDTSAANPQGTGVNTGGQGNSNNR